MAGEHPAHVAAEWLGHSTLVATKHYWQTTEDDFAKAVEGADIKAAQNPAQSAHATGCIEPQVEIAAAKKTLVLPEFATEYETMQHWTVGEEGLEPPTSTV